MFLISASATCTIPQAPPPASQTSFRYVSYPIQRPKRPPEHIPHTAGTRNHGAPKPASHFQSNLTPCQPKPLNQKTHRITINKYFLPLHSIQFRSDQTHSSTNFVRYPPHTNSYPCARCSLAAHTTIKNMYPYKDGLDVDSPAAQRHRTTVRRPSEPARPMAPQTWTWNTSQRTTPTTTTTQDEEQTN